MVSQKTKTNKKQSSENIGHVYYHKTNTNPENVSFTWNIRNKSFQSALNSLWPRSVKTWKSTTSGWKPSENITHWGPCGTWMAEVLTQSRGSDWLQQSRLMAEILTEVRGSDWWQILTDDRWQKSWLTTAQTVLMRSQGSTVGGVLKSQRPPPTLCRLKDWLSSTWQKSSSWNFPAVIYLTF